MEMENIMLSEVSQFQKDKGHILPHVWKLDLRDLKYIYDLIYMG
jgi:hypothetical protein